MVKLFNIGHISIYLFGVMVALGIITGILVALKEGKRKGIDENKFFDVVLGTLIASLIGARLYYIIAFDFQYYIQNPNEILRVTSGGLSIQGGIIGGVLFGICFARAKKISFLKSADAVAPGIAIGQAIGRIGCDVFGIPMSKIYPWGVKVGSQILHPAQMYEMILDLVLFTYLWRNKGKSKYDGQLFIKYIVGFSINRFIVELVRTNPIIIGDLTIAHVTSIIIIIIAIAVSLIIRKKSDDYIVGIEEKRDVIPMYHYFLIVLVAIVGFIIYYAVH